MTKVKQAYFGGGCFWCLEAVFEKLKGVNKVTSGYAGGHDPKPTYNKVCTGETGHAEIVRIDYDPAEISYEDLLKFFWTFHDPTTLNRQGNDIGTQYRSIIFYQDEAEKEAIRASISTVAGKLYSDPVVTEVLPLETFYPAEEIHYQYFRRNPQSRYCQLVIAPKIVKLRQEYHDKITQS